MLSFFPQNVLDEIWDIIKSVSEGFPTYSFKAFSPLVGPRSAVGSASDSRARVSGFDTRSGHILSFLLQMINEWAVVSHWRKYVHAVLVNRLICLSLHRKSVVRLIGRPDMTTDVYRGRKTTTPEQQNQSTRSGEEKC